MLEKVKVLDQVEVRSNGVIFIKELNQIIDNGIVISSVPHRSSVSPLDDVSNHEYQMVRDIAAAAWTPQIIANYNLEVSNRQNALGGS